MLARRAEHFFGESSRVRKGVDAWRRGDLTEFGRLVSASGQSSISNYECGCEPLIQLRAILLSTPGVLGARFSGAGFRGCCVALVEAELAETAAQRVRAEYARMQPLQAAGMAQQNVQPVWVCDSGDGARLYQTRPPERSAF